MDMVDISNLVVGNPPTVFNPTYFTRRVRALKTASESGDLRKIRELLSGSDKLGGYPQMISLPPFP